MFGGGDQLPNPNQHQQLVQFPINPNAMIVQGPAAVKVDAHYNSLMVPKAEMQSGAPKAESVMGHSKKFQDDLEKLGLKLKHHEENIKFLKSEKNRLDELILDNQVALGKYHSTDQPNMQNMDLSHVRSEEDTAENILRHENSAAGILYQLKSQHGTQGSHFPVTKDVLGVVATLGKVDDDNLSRLLSEYLGINTMLAIVCKTYEGVKALESYDKEGFVNKSSGLHGLGSSVGRSLNGRYLVICLQKLSPYPGKFIAHDPQRKLDLMKPRLPNGESTPGFLGYAVNLITIDSINLQFVTTNGNGLRETLFYNLFSRLQVYRTRAEMLQALPFITSGAISLDGGMIKCNGVFALGDREEIDVKFPKSPGMLNLPENYFETERRIKEMTWKKERILEDIRREQQLFDQAKFNYEIQKQQFVKFLAESSSYISQHQASTPR